MLNLLLEQDSFDKEKNVVLEERKMRYENSPRGKIYLETMSFMNKGTPYEESVIGKIEDIQSYKREQVLEYFHHYYAPNNAVVVIVGDVDSRKTMNLVKRYFGQIPYSQNVDKLKQEKDRAQLFVRNNPIKGQEIKLKGASKNPLFYLAYYAYPIGSRESHFLSLLSIILGSGESSYFNTQYVNNKNPLALEMGAFDSSLQFSGVFIVYGELMSGRSAKEFKKEWDLDIKKICRESITARTLGKAKNQYFTSYFEELKTNGGLAHFLGLNEMYMGDPRYYKKEIEAISKVNVSDLTSLCEDLFAKNGSNYFVLWEKH
jgi:zinc protease